MAGRPGRSGGHNKLSVEEHLLRGTYNATRHGPRPSAVKTAVVPIVEPPPAALLAGLVGRGKAFVEEAWALYEGFSLSDLALLHEAGVLIDQLEGLRGQPGERQAQRLLLATFNALQLGQGQRPAVPAPASAPASKWDGLLR